MNLVCEVTAVTSSRTHPGVGGALEFSGLPLPHPPPPSVPPSQTPRAEPFTWVLCYPHVGKKLEIQFYNLKMMCGETEESEHKQLCKRGKKLDDLYYLISRFTLKLQ